jgi:hypothetical protein
MVKIAIIGLYTCVQFVTLCFSDVGPFPYRTSKVKTPRTLKRRRCSIYGSPEDRRRKVAGHVDITGHSRGCGKPSTSVSPHSATRPLQDANNEVQEPPEIPLVGGWTMPKGKQPQLILTEVAGIDPGVAALLADGTPYDFHSAIIDDSIINRMVDQVARWVSYHITFSTIFKATGYKIIDDICRTACIAVPAIADHWSKRFLYKNEETPSGNRFELVTNVALFQ